MVEQAAGKRRPRLALLLSAAAAAVVTCSCGMTPASASPAILASGGAGATARPGPFGSPHRSPAFVPHAHHTLFRLHGRTTPRQQHAWPSVALRPPTPQSVGGRGRSLRASVDVGLALYDLQIWAKGLVDTQLTHLTPVSGAVLYGAGLLTSLSPCALSLVPLTMAYLTDDGSDSANNRQTLFFRAAMFTVGLASSLSVLGLSATLAGKLFGSAGAGALGAVLPLTASMVAIVMGLNLLELISLRLPSFEASLQLEKFPPSLQAFLLGATSALIASPCSTPVLASILGFVAASGDGALGAGLLFAYSLGYSTPVLLAGLLSGTVTSFISQKGDGFSWVTPATGALLISYGTYSSLNALFPM